MTNHKRTYRALQQHLNRQPVGFPAALSGADLALLRELFTPREAELAAQLSHKPQTAEDIAAKVSPLFPPSETEQLLESRFVKGSLGRREKEGVAQWYLMPLVVGMYESQDGAPSRRFLMAAMRYMSTFAFGKSFLSVRPSQMRTIPVNKSITVEHNIAPYHQIRPIIENAPGPFVVLNCICRLNAKARRAPCQKTQRSETCLGFGNLGATVLRRKHGREVSREEALAILAKNEEEGLVLQPAGAQNPEFVCSCCGCCCGMLGLHKKLPHPVDFWTSSFYAEVSEERCQKCGKCVARCQVNAVTLSGPEGRAQVNLSRCIGCGLCVTTCAPEALNLVKKEKEPPLPLNEEALLEEIGRNKRSALGEWAMLLKVMLGMRQ
jgi:Na+-translocating ferredoxin:NAD+ oxidoreductase subunit B